jgi:PKD repeat protein
MMYKKSRPFALFRLLSTLTAPLNVMGDRRAMAGAWKTVALTVMLCWVVSSSDAATWYVDNSLSSSANVGTNWSDAWTNLNYVSGVVAGDTVYISGGSVSQTYTFTASGLNDNWILATGVSNNPVTYMVGQDAGHNGIVVMNGSGNGGAVNLSGSYNFTTVSGNYQGQNHLVFTNFSGNSWICDGSIGMVLRYATIFAPFRALNGHLMELDHIINYPMPGGDNVMCFITDAAAQGYMDNFIHDCTFYIPRQAPNTLQADCNGFIPTNFSGCGDVAIASAAGCTISNCVFTTTLMANYTAGHHGDGIQSAGPWLRVMDSYFANIPNYTIFGDVTASSAHDIEVFNNVITYTDPGFTNSCCSYAITIGQDGLAPTAVISNVFVMNNTVVDGPHGIAIGSAENATLYNNCWAVNNLCVNNTGVEGPYNSVILPSEDTSLYNKAVGSGGVVPANLAGPANGNPVTFVSYTPYSANNDFHLAASDTGATGNGTNWPVTFFGADMDGNSRLGNMTWDIGAYVSNTNNVVPQPIPVAGFSGQPTSGPAVLTVTFTDTSTGWITNRVWHFGDGSSTTTMSTTVVHQYMTPGTNSVNLRVYGPSGENMDVQPDLVAVMPAGGDTNAGAPVASFGAAPTSGTAPLTVTFTDTSTGTITNRSWQFGDGTVINTMATIVIYQYTIPGTDTVQLVVSGPGGSSTNIQANLITVGASGGGTLPPPVALFGATPTSGTAPLTVTFTDASTGTITNRSWQFGDGNVINTMATTVIYQYTTPGTDTVQLVVSGPGGSSTNIQANLIAVGTSGGGTNGVPAPVASFGATPTSGKAPLTVTFTDTSTGSITNRLWYFGDGTSANTSGATMSHQYTRPGTNSVQLVVSGPGGTAVDVQGNLIIVISRSGYWRHMRAY